MKGYISGATGFLGRMLASHFVDKNCSLTLAGRDVRNLEELRSELLGLAVDPNLTIDIHAIDFSQPAHISQQLERLNAETFDWCINAVGVQGTVGSELDLTYVDYQENLNVNLLSPIEFTRWFSKQFLRVNTGRIIHFSGGGSSNVRPYFSPYAISKTALARFVENTAFELQSYNIQLFSIAPGLMPSKMLGDSLSRPEYLQKSQIEVIESALNKHSDFDGEKILNLVDFLLSGMADAFSGKMVSAQWDNWSEWPNHSDEIKNSDLYTLRRITGRDRGQDWGDL
jgi:3-oxoacyl-[acyl-carrier protein] reductase